MATIVVDSVNKRLGANQIYTDASAEFEPGEIAAITGPNGSGKSVMFRMICGFMRPDSGEIRIAPEYLEPGATYPQGFGILIDGPGYLPFARGYDNLERLADIRGEVARPEIESAMRAVGLDPHLKQRVRSYSLGMKQKLGIAQAIMEDQKVLLLDEPFNGLDRSSVARLHGLLAEMKKAGKTIVFTSHIGADVEALADRVYEVDEARLLRVH